MTDKISHILQQVWEERPLALGILFFVGIGIWFLIAFFRDRRAEFDPELVIQFIRLNYTPSERVSRPGGWVTLRSRDEPPIRIRFRLELELPPEMVNQAIFQLEILASGLKSATLTFNAQRHLLVYETDGERMFAGEVSPKLVARLEYLVVMLIAAREGRALPPEA